MVDTASGYRWRLSLAVITVTVNRRKDRECDAYHRATSGRGVRLGHTFPFV